MMLHREIEVYEVMGHPVPLWKRWCLYFHIKVPEANVPFRRIKAGVFEKYIYKLPDDYNLPNIMLATFFVHYHENVIYKGIRVVEIIKNARISRDLGKYPLIDTTQVNVPRLSIFLSVCS